MKKYFHIIFLITFVEKGIKLFVRAAEEDKIVIEYSSQEDLRSKLEGIVQKELNEHEEWCKDIVLVPKKKEENLSNVTTVADPATTSGYLSTPGISTASESSTDAVTTTFSQTTSGPSPSPSVSSVTTVTDLATTNGYLSTLGIPTASESSSDTVTTTFSKATTAFSLSPTVSSVTTVADPTITNGYLSTPGISTASESSSDTVTTTFSQASTGSSPSPSVSSVTSVADPATTNGYLSTLGISTASESSSDTFTATFSQATTAPLPSPSVSSATTVADPTRTNGYLSTAGYSTASESSSDTFTTTFSQATTDPSPSPPISSVTTAADPATTNGYLSTPGISTASESSSDIVTTTFSQATTALSTSPSDDCAQVGVYPAKFCCWRRNEYYDCYCIPRTPGSDSKECGNPFPVCQTGHSTRQSTTRCNACECSLATNLDGFVYNGKWYFAHLDVKGPLTVYQANSLCAEKYAAKPADILNITHQSLFECYLRTKIGDGESFVVVWLAATFNTTENQIYSADGQKRYLEIRRDYPKTHGSYVHDKAMRMMVVEDPNSKRNGVYNQPFNTERYGCICEKQCRYPQHIPET